MLKMQDPVHWDEAASHYETTAHPFTEQFAKEALAQITVTPGLRVLDVATGTGALALAAARVGAEVLATDFSPGMVARVIAHGLPNIEGRAMDGQALDLPDASFDAVFSIFGLIMFPDWRKGLREMVRVTRPGGHGVVGIWQSDGAATHLLLTRLGRTLFPERDWRASLPEGNVVLGEPGRLAAELVVAGYREPAVTEAVHDYPLDVALLDDPDKLFGMSEGWVGLSDGEKDAIVAEVRRMAAGRSILPVPSTALIGVGRR